MANIIDKSVGKVLKKYNDLTLDSAGVLTGPINKLWRARILLNRSTSPFQKDDAKNGKSYKPNNGKDKLPVINKVSKERVRMSMKFSEAPSIGPDPAMGNMVDKNREMFKMDEKLINANQVIIYNLNTSPYQYIVLQNRPTSIDFRGEATWATIKSMGRNTPMYHYIGSEDIIQLNISWFCNDPENPAEVINKCRLLERWTKSDGYKSSPPLLKLHWGNSNIFEDHLYILSSATYTLNNFQNISRQRIPSKEQILTDKQLFPASATQELIFKRVSGHNLSYNDIVSDELLRKTKGISI